MQIPCRNIALLLLLAALLLGCGAVQDTVCDTPPPPAEEGETPPPAEEGENPPPPAEEGENPPPAEEGEDPPDPDQPPVFYTYKVVNQYPHDPMAFTQGLQFVDGELFEGTGLKGQSSLRRVALDTGQVLQILELDNQYFGEGITVMGEKIFQLTWQEKTGFVYRKNSFELITTFSYPTEGWGLTHDGQRLIMSDGSATLYFFDPVSLTRIGEIEAVGENGPVNRLNELEYINGKVYANVWQTNRIVIISPDTGKITGIIDLQGILPQESRTGLEDVLNGIAYDEAGDRLFVTGKRWGLLFEIDLVAVK